MRLGFQPKIFTGACLAKRRNANKAIAFHSAPRNTAETNTWRGENLEIHPSSSPSPVGTRGGKKSCWRGGSRDPRRNTRRILVSKGRKEGWTRKIPSSVEELSPENLQFLHQFSVSIFCICSACHPTTQPRNLFSRTRLPLRSLALLVNHRSSRREEEDWSWIVDQLGPIFLGKDCICPVDSNDRSRDNEAMRHWVASLFRRIVCVYSGQSDVWSLFQIVERRGCDLKIFFFFSFSITVDSIDRCSRDNETMRHWMASLLKNHFFTTVVLFRIVKKEHTTFFFFQLNIFLGRVDVAYVDVASRFDTYNTIVEEEEDVILKFWQKKTFRRRWWWG